MQGETLHIALSDPPIPPVMYTSTPGDIILALLDWVSLTKLAASQCKSLSKYRLYVCFAYTV